MVFNKSRRKTFLHWMDYRLHGSYGNLIVIFVILSLFVFIATWMIRRAYGDADGYRALLSLINPFDDPREVSASKRIWDALFACVGSVVFMGVLVSTIVNWVEKRRSGWQYGEFRYKIRKPYSLIIGSQPLLTGLVKQLQNNDKDRCILILTEREAYRVRNELSEVVDNLYNDRIIIYTGSIFSVEELKLTRPDNAIDIYILGEKEPSEKSTHDNKCLRIFNTLCECYTSIHQGPTIPVHVLFERNASFKAFLHTDMAYTLNSPYKFIPYNYYDLWGQMIFGAMTSRHIDADIEYRPLDGGKGIRYKDKNYVHLVVVGFDEMARSLCLQAAQLCHFPNFCNDELQHPRTLITVISPGLRHKAYEFINLYSSYFSHTNYRLTDSADLLLDTSWNKDRVDEKFITDTSWEFIAADINYPVVREYLSKAAQRSEDIMTIVVSQPSPDKSVETALSLPADIYSNVNQILVRQDVSKSILFSLNKGFCKSDKYNTKPVVVAFGMSDGLLFSDITSSKPSYFIGLSYEAAKELASSAEDFNTAISQEKRLQFHNKYIREVEACLENKVGDIDWDLPLSPRIGKSFISLRYSNIYHAYSLGYRQRSFDMTDKTGLYFDESNPTLLAETEHNRWITEQLIAGFRVPGPSDEISPLDHIATYHPNLLPFNKLSDYSKIVAFAMSSVAPVIIMSHRLSQESFSKRIKYFKENVCSQE